MIRINNVIDNISGFTTYLEALNVDLRIAIIEYKDITEWGEEESTVIHLLNHSPWHYTSDQVAETLSSIYVDGGGDEAETLVDALGCLLSDDTMLFRSNANKFAIVLTDADYKVDNTYGYESMDDVISALVLNGIYTSVISSSYYESYYSSLYERTGGIFADINADFAEILQSFADNIFGISTSDKKAIYVLPGYMGSKLYDPDGNEMWLNTDNLKDDIISNYLPGGKTSIIVGNNDGSGGSVSADITKDAYGTWDTYKSLVTELKKQCGEEYDVIFFPYNWIGDLNESATLLKNHIVSNGYDKVVFVTHSTGGLLASTFIAKSTENKRLVEKAILIAAPLYGTYSALIPIETGEYQDLISKNIKEAVPWYLEGIGVAAGHKWAKDVTKNSPTTYQLLPNEQYLKLMAALYMDDTTNAVTTASKYYEVLNGSGNINSNLTNGNSRSHKYFRDTVLNKDIVSVLQEVDTYLVGCNYYETDNEDDMTPAIAVYSSKLLGGTKLKEIQHNKNGDGTVMGVSSAAVDSSGNAILPYKNFKNIDHTALVSDASVLRYVCNTIMGVSTFALDESPMAASASFDAGMSSMIKVIASADREFSTKVYDAGGQVVAESTETDYYGWNEGKLKLNILSDDEDDYSLQLYMPNTGYRVDFTYGIDPDVEINTELSISTLDYDGNKTAIAQSSDTVTGADGILFTLDTISSVASSDTLETIVTNASDTPAQKTVYDTNWDISTSVKLDNIGDSSTITLTGGSTTAGNLSWFSSDDNVVTVDENGVVTAIGYGVATVTAVQEGSLKAENCIVTVKLNAGSVQFADIEMIVGEKVKISPVFDSESVTETEIEYLVSDNGIISIDAYGVITALAAGTVTVTGTAPGGATNTFAVDVGTSSVIAVESISLSKTSVEVYAGGTTTIEATIEPADASNTDILWFVDDETIATIDYTGQSCKIYGIFAGTTKVTAVTQDGGYTASCEIKVSSSGGGTDVPSTPTPSGGGDSSDSDPTYSITVPSRVTGGTVKVTPTNASEGQRVTITVKPSTGYELDTLTVTDSQGNTLTLTDQGDGKYTFIMPKSKVSVDVSFKAIASVAPAAPINFTDVQSSAYYYDAVLWAVENGITAGTSDTTFSPDAPCTRAQIVSFLWRAAGSPEMSGANPFTDVSAADYYYDAVLWAVENGVTAGITSTTFSPNEPCTRAQAVSFLYRAKNSPEVSGTSSFMDLVSGAYYMDAVQWAVNAGVTAGTSDTTFSPEQVCTRAHIVSFLYRDRAN